MSGLPNSWEDGTTVEDVATIRSGNGFPKKYQGRTEGELPFFKVGDISRNWQKGKITLTTADHYLTRAESKEIRAKTFPEGTVVFAKIGAAVALNRRAILGSEALIDNNVIGLVPSDATTSRFLFYFMCQVDLGASTRGGAVPSLRKGDVGDLNIPLPPLSEQRRIVARIEEIFSRLDAGVAALRHAKAQLQRYRQSALAAAVTGQLTQAWREQHPDTEPAEELLERILQQRREQWCGRGKYKEPIGYPGVNPFETPDSWSLVNFEQVSRRVTVGHVGSMKNEYTDAGIPFLRGQNVRANRFDAKGLKFVSAEFHQSLAKSTLHGGDIAVTRSGDVGIACVIPETLGEANCSDLVLILGPILIDPNYAAYFMNSLGRRLVQKGKVGVAITHFNTKSVAAMPLPLPPLAEQHQIVAEVEARTTAIDHLEAELDRQISRSNRLRQSTLAAAFTGNLLYAEAKQL